MKMNTVTELQNRIADCNNKLTNAIKSDYPIGSVVGICANPNDPEFIIVGHIVDGTKEPLIQIACLNPRTANARSVSNYSYKDAFDLVFPKVQNNKEIPLAYTTPSGTNEFFKMWQKNNRR